MNLVSNSSFCWNLELEFELVLTTRATKYGKLRLFYCFHLHPHFRMTLHCPVLCCHTEKNRFHLNSPLPSSWKNIEVPHPLLVLEKDFGSPTPCPSKELDSCVEGLGVGGELHNLRAMLSRGFMIFIY